MPDDDDFTSSPIPAIAEAIPGSDMTWFHQFREKLFPTFEERIRIEKEMPPVIGHIPCVFLAFDLDGGDMSMKAYFSPLLKTMASPGPNYDLETVEMLKGLKPYGEALTPALEAIEEYRNLKTEESVITVVAIECINPENARVKLYTTPPSTTFDALRDYITFGGKLQDQETLKGLDILREIWHFLINEDDEVEDSFSKQLIVSDSGHKGVCCSWEIRVGQKYPDTKVYVPLFQYFKNDRDVAKMMTKVFAKLGWEWRSSSKYSDLVENAL